MNAEDILTELKARLISTAIHPGTAAGIHLSGSTHSRTTLAHTTQISKPASSPSGSKPQARQEEKRIREKPDDPIDHRIVLRLEAGQAHIDRLAADLDLPVGKLSERLLLLEMRGMVRRLPGMSFDLA